ncbi:MAG TPA: TolC family protein [bacterium]|nr:TolC family protein [bacterium]HPP29358.1 TolC family protein [bacterium]
MKKFILLLFLSVSLSFSQEILTLDDAISIALKNNLKIKMAQSVIEQAYYQKEVASSYFLPRFSTSFSYTYLGDNQPISFGGLPIPPVKLTDDNLYKLTFTVNQPIFTGGKITKGYELSKEAYEKAMTDYEAEVQNTVMDVKKAYFNVLKAERFLEVSKKYKELMEKHLKDVKEMFEEGLATKLDILKIELGVKQAETKITESENYVKIAKANLNFLMNRALDNEFELKDILEIKEAEKKDYQWWRETALRERNEIKSMEKVLSIYEKNIGIERSALFPQLYLFFNYNIEKGTQTSMNDWEDNWNTGILLSYDIWNWGETRNRIKKTEKEKEEMERQFNLLKDTIEIEVKDAYLNLISAETKVGQCQKQIELAEENLRVAEMLYKEGMATTTDIVDATTSLTDARNSYYNALYEYQVAYAQLEKAIGKQGE